MNDKIWSVLKGALIAGAAALVVSLSNHLGDLNLDATLAPWAVAVVAITIQSARKWLEHISEGPTAV